MIFLHFFPCLYLFFKKFLFFLVFTLYVGIASYTLMGEIN